MVGRFEPSNLRNQSATESTYSACPSSPLSQLIPLNQACTHPTIFGRYNAVMQLTSHWRRLRERFRLSMIARPQSFDYLPASPLCQGYHLEALRRRESFVADLCVPSLHTLSTPHSNSRSTVDLAAQPEECHDLNSTRRCPSARWSHTPTHLRLIQAYWPSVGRHRRLSECRNSQRPNVGLFFRAPSGLKRAVLGDRKSYGIHDGIEMGRLYPFPMPSN